MERCPEPQYRTRAFKAKETLATLLILGSVTTSLAIAERVHNFLRTSENAPTILFTVIVLSTLIGINARLRKNESAQKEPIAFAGLSNTSLPGFSDDISSICWDIPPSNRLN